MGELKGPRRACFGDRLSSQVADVGTTNTKETALPEWRQGGDRGINKVKKRNQSEKEKAKRQRGENLKAWNEDVATQVMPVTKTIGANRSYRELGGS